MRLSPRNVILNANVANTSDSNHKDDELISLEALVQESDVSSPPGTATDKIDEILEIEDPAFTAELRELAAIGAEPTEVDVVPDSEIENTVAREKAELGSKGRKKIYVFLVKRPMRRLKQFGFFLKSIVTWLKVSGKPMLISGAKTALTSTKGGLNFVLGKVKAVLAAFGALPKKSKFLVLSVIILGVLAGAMTLVAYRGGFLPNLEKNFLVNFSTAASETFKIEKDAKWVDLNDPMLHPEHIVLVERIIANLKPPGDGSNPMALIDLYLEAGTQESAIELKDRDSESRDVISRTLEQMTYDELITEAGKTKLKIFIRKNLNDNLTSGRIRRVFFKSIVLKP